MHKMISIGLAVLITVSFLISYQVQQKSEEMLNQLDLTCGFTDHFAEFIKKTGNYSSWNFERSDLKCGAFGGKINDKNTISKTPIIFIHGNSDLGFGRGTADGYLSFQTGFRTLATYFGTQGYTKAQLYTTTWGDANINHSSQNNHKKKYILQMRAFVEAVIAYTGTSKVNIIGHSMGVTIGRKIIKGGPAIDHNQGNYNVGSSLHDKVNTFVGLAGGNLGLTACIGMDLIPTCSNTDGFNPGLLVTSGPSKFLSDLNINGGSEGSKVYAIWSKDDDVINLGCVVWGKVTCRIPGQNGQVVKSGIHWTHMAVRDNTGPDMIGWL